MKLISLNIEGGRNEELSLPFIEKEDADVVCLMEAPEFWCEKLEVLGYHTTFAPMQLRNNSVRPAFVEGIILASKNPYQSTTEYYHGSETSITQELHRAADTVSRPVIIAEIEHESQTYTVATTHMSVTLDGTPNEHQRDCVAKLLTTMEQHEPHIICGDFNMPRGVNDLYEEVTKRYTDAIPAHYTSSLDRNIHRMGNDPGLNAPIFDTFMVDYIFTQTPYTAKDVRLEFNLSDHAGVVATIDKSDE